MSIRKVSYTYRNTNGNTVAGCIQDSDGDTLVCANDNNTITMQVNGTVRATVEATGLFRINNGAAVEMTTETEGTTTTWTYNAGLPAGWTATPTNMSEALDDYAAGDPLPWQAAADRVLLVRIGDSANTDSNAQIALLGAASDTEAIAIGESSAASGAQSICIGTGIAAASGVTSIAIGQDAVSGAGGNDNTIAIGGGSSATALDAIAVGGGITNAVEETVLLGTNGIDMLQLSAAATGSTVVSAPDVGTVTVNATSGSIKTAALASLSGMDIILSNTFITTSSKIFLTCIATTLTAPGTRDTIGINLTSIGAGTCTIHIFNHDALATTTSVIIKFFIVI